MRILPAKNSMLILFCVGFVAMTLIAFFVYPSFFLKIYKHAYINYKRINNQNNFANIKRAQLDTAIAHARQQDWVQQQISHDLQPYQNGITAAQIDQWFRIMQPSNNYQVFKIKIQNASVNMTPDDVSTPAFKTIFSALNFLAKQHLIPNCEFLIVLNDYLAYIPENVTEPIPIFTFAKHLARPIEATTILIPDWMNLRSWDSLRGRIAMANYLFPWSRKQNIIFWRGGLADSMQHRSKLLQLKNNFTFVDAAITGGNKPAPIVDAEQSLRYKYQIALDGHRGTWERMVWQMHSNSVMIKPNSPQVQWFHRGLIPFINYVPIAEVDENNIREIYTWLQNHDALAQQISENARAFAEQNLKTEDFLAYYVLLLQAYAKLYES